MNEREFTTLLTALEDEDLSLVSVGERPHDDGSGPRRCYYIEREGIVFMVSSAEVVELDDARDALNFVFDAAEDAMLDDRAAMTREQFDELERDIEQEAEADVGEEDTES